MIAAIRCLIRERSKPDEDVFPFAYWQLWIGVLGWFGHEVPQKSRPCRAQQRDHGVFKEIHESRINGCIKSRDGRADDPSCQIFRVLQWAICRVEAKTSGSASWPEQENVAHITDRVVGRRSMRLPEWAHMVEILQRCASHLYISKPTQPDEAIRVGAIAKLTGDERTIVLLLFNELIASPWVVNILAQFYNRTTGLFGLLRGVSRACA